MKKITYKGIDECIYYEKMPNGLEVFMYPSPTAKNFYLAYNVRFGSIDTEFKKGREKHFTKVPNGTAHFLEHQMFQEEKGHTAFERFSTLGSSVNAFTTYNYTSYEVNASDRFKENLEYLLKYVETPVFKPKSISQEKGIIAEEISMYDNTPMSVLNFGLEYNLNQVDGHKYLISGTEEDIQEITAEILSECYDTFYTPSNMFLVLTGKFLPLEALGIIKSVESTRKEETKKRITRRTVPEPIEVETPYEERQMDVSIPKLKVAYKLDKKRFKNYTDLQLKIYLDAILTARFGEISDLYESLNEQNLTIGGIYANREIRDDYIVLSFEVETEYKEQVLDEIRSELKNIKLTKEELERIIKMNKANFILHFNDIMDVAQDIEDDVLSTGRITENILEVYDDMSLEIAADIAGKIKVDNECVFYINKLSE